MNEPNAQPTTFALDIPGQLVSVNESTERSKLTDRSITASVVTAPVIGFGVDMTSCRDECSLAFSGLV